MYVSLVKSALLRDVSSYWLLVSRCTSLQIHLQTSAEAQRNFLALPAGTEALGILSAHTWTDT